MINDIDHTLSQYEKNKDNFQWDKDVLVLLQSRMGVDANTRAKLEFKEELAKGKMPKLNAQQQQNLNIKMYGHARKKDFNLIPHFPLIDQVLEEAVGELERQPFEPSAEDISLFSKNIKDSEHKQEMEAWLMQNKLKPFYENLTQEYFLKYGIADLAQLSHEDQQQVQSDIENRKKQLTPKDINNYFENDYYSPFSEMAQFLTDLECKSKNLKNHFDKRFRHGYVNGAQISYIHKSHGLPRITQCHRKYFDWEGDEGVDTIEDGFVAFYDYPRSLIQTYVMYGEQLTDADIKKLEKNNDYSRGINGDFNILGPVQETAMLSFYYDNHKELFPDGINWRSEEGQRILMQIRQLTSRGIHPSRMVRDCHAVWITSTHMKLVERNVKGRKERAWRHNDYVMNPDYGDISVQKVRGMQVRGCRSLGEGNNKVFIDAGPLDFDWADIYDPIKRKLPYTGGFYGLDFGRSITAPFDKGINFQIKINVEAARLEEEKGFDLGKMFVMLESAMPDGYTPEIFFDTMKGTRIINLDENKLNPQIASALMSGGRVFNSIDMGNQVKVKEAAEEIERLYYTLKRAMGLDGKDISPYDSIENVRQRQQMASSRTFDVYNKHSRWQNNTLQMYMDFCMDTYRQNPGAIEQMTSDLNMAMLMSDEFLQFGRVGVFVGNSVEDQVAIREFKQEMLPFIQNEAYEVLEDFARIKKAKSWGEVLNATQSLSRKSAAMRQAAQEAAIAQQQEERAALAEQKQMDYDHQDRQLLQKSETSIDLAEINSREQANAVDINKNSQNDFTEQAEKDLAYQRERDNKDRALEYKKADDKLKVDLAKVMEMQKNRRLTKKAKK